MNKLRLILLCMSIVWCTSYQRVCAENQSTLSPKKIATKLIGSVCASTLTYHTLFSIAPLLFSDLEYKNIPQFLVMQVLKVLAVGAASYYGAEYAWSLTTEGKIEWAQRCVDNYGYTLVAASGAGKDLFAYLEKRFVGSQMPMMVAFKYISNARSDLQGAKEALDELKNGSVDYHQAIDSLLPKIQQLLEAADNVLIAITRHPQWINYMSIEEMRLNRLQPKIQYNLN